MSAINEAYARIDYATIQQMQKDINTLKKYLPKEVFAKIRDDKRGVNKTRVFARAIKLESGSSDSKKVEFGSGTFDLPPIVTATIYDPTKNKVDTEGATIVMRDLTKTGVTIDIKRKGKGNIVVHIIAIGALD